MISGSRFVEFINFLWAAKFLITIYPSLWKDLICSSVSFLNDMAGVLPKISTVGAFQTDC
jgi:hypothetical protein